METLLLLTRRCVHCKDALECGTEISCIVGLQLVRNARNTDEEAVNQVSAAPGRKQGRWGLTHVSTYFHFKAKRIHSELELAILESGTSFTSRCNFRRLHSQCNLNVILTLGIKGRGFTIALTTVKKTLEIRSAFISLKVKKVRLNQYFKKTYPV